MRNVTILRVAMPLAVLAVAALAVPAYGDWIETSWTGATQSFHDNTNPPWDNGAPPADPGDDDWIAYISNGGTAQITLATTMSQFYVGKYGATGGQHYGHATMGVGNYTVTVSSFAVGHDTKPGDLSTFTQSGGKIDSQYLTIAYTSANGYGNGKYEISGGSIVQPDADWRHVTLGPYNAGKDLYGRGRFKVVGTGPTEIKVNAYRQYVESTLEIALDDDPNSTGNNVTPIQVIGTATGASDPDRGNATLAGTLEVNYVLDGGNPLYTPQLGDTVTVLTVTDGTIVRTGLTLDAPDPDGDGNYWDFNPDAGAGTLGLKYVPEPATLCLLGIGGIGVLIRRRKR